MNKKTIRIIDLAVLGTLVVGVVTFSLMNILVSNSKYRVYENEYNAELEAVENAKPKGPESVKIDNDFVTYDENKEFSSVFMVRCVKGGKMGVVVKKPHIIKH